jgi:hypothetical protein
MSPPAALSEKRSTRVTSRYDADSQECVINLQYAEVEKEKAKLNEAIRFARRQGPLRRIVLVIASEVFGQPESYLFMKRNSFVRNEGREGGAGGFIVLEKQLEEK